MGRQSRMSMPCGNLPHPLKPGEKRQAYRDGGTFLLLAFHRDAATVKFHTAFYNDQSKACAAALAHIAGAVKGLE